MWCPSPFQPRAATTSSAGPATPARPRSARLRAPRRRRWRRAFAAGGTCAAAHPTRQPGPAAMPPLAQIGAAPGAVCGRVTLARRPVGRCWGCALWRGIKEARDAGAGGPHRSDTARRGRRCSRAPLSALPPPPSAGNGAGCGGVGAARSRVGARGRAGLDRSRPRRSPAAAGRPPTPSPASPLTAAARQPARPRPPQRAAAIPAAAPPPSCAQRDSPHYSPAARNGKMKRPSCVAIRWPASAAARTSHARSQGSAQPRRRRNWRT